MHRRTHPQSLQVLFAAALLPNVVSCYNVAFDDEASDIFACTQDSECREDFVCWNGACVDDRGPQLTVLGPEPLSAFDSGTAEVEIAFRGADFTLSNNFESATEGEGYLEVYVDGVAVRSKDAGTAITEGDLQNGFSIGAVAIPDPTVVNHRIEVRTYRGDGTRYENPSGTGRQVFFVRDASLFMSTSRPMMAITRPWPGSKITRGRPVSVELAAVDFTWNNPTGEASPSDIKVGHAHVFFGRDDYPECLPGCNGLYVDTLRPANGLTSDERILRTDDLEHSDSQSSGSFIVSAGLQRNNHAPWPGMDPLGGDFLVADAIADNVVVELVD